MAKRKDEQLTEWLTPEQAAAELGVTSRWVRNLIERGVLEGQKLSDRVLLVKRSSLANFTPKHKRKDKPIE